MEPELGRDVTVATVLIAAIVALATGSVMFGLAVLGAAALVLGAVTLIRYRGGHSGANGRTEAPRRSGFTGPQSH